MSEGVITTESTEVRKPVNAVTDRVIGAAIDVLRELGPGLLINFNVQLLKHGIRRLVLTTPADPSF